MRRKIAWIVCGLVLALLIALNLALAIPPLLRLGIRGYADYIAFYSAGRIIADHQGRLLYSPGAQMSVQRQLVGFSNPLLPYTHLPFEALIFACLVWLPFDSSLWLWVVISIGLLLAFVYLIRPYLSPAAPRSPGLLFALALAFWPVLFGLNHGQDSILELLFFTLVFTHLKRGRDFAAGCWLALAMVKWQYVLPVLLLVAFRKQWKVLGGFALAGAILGVISLSLTGPAAVGSYWVLVTQYSGTWDQFYAMPSLFGLVSMWAGGTVGHATAAVLSIVAMLLPLTIVTFGDTTRDTSLDLQFSLALTVAVLAGYHVYIHDLTILLLPLFVVGALLFAEKRWGALLGCGSFLLIQLYWAFAPNPQLAYIALLVIPFALFIWTMARRKMAPLSHAPAAVGA